MTALSVFFVVFSQSTIILFSFFLHKHLLLVLVGVRPAFRNILRLAQDTTSVGLGQCLETGSTNTLVIGAMRA